MRTLAEFAEQLRRRFDENSVTVSRRPRPEFGRDNPYETVFDIHEIHFMRVYPSSPDYLSLTFRADGPGGMVICTDAFRTAIPPVSILTRLAHADRSLREGLSLALMNGRGSGEDPVLVKHIQYEVEAIAAGLGPIQ